MNRLWLVKRMAKRKRLYIMIGAIKKNHLLFYLKFWGSTPIWALKVVIRYKELHEYCFSGERDFRHL